MFEQKDLITGLLSSLLKMIYLKSLWISLIVFCGIMHFKHEVWLAAFVALIVGFVCLFIIPFIYESHKDKKQMKVENREKIEEQREQIKNDIINEIGRTSINYRNQLNCLIKNNKLIKSEYPFGPSYSTLNGTVYEYFEVDQKEKETDKGIEVEIYTRIKDKYYPIFKEIYMEYNEDFYNIHFSNSLLK